MPINCPTCGKTSLVGTFCEHCGAPLPVLSNQPDASQVKYEQSASPALYCPTCGAGLQFKDAEICPKCGVRIKSPSGMATDRVFAGFWNRFGGYLIDAIILSVITIVISFFIGVLYGISMYSSRSHYSNNSDLALTGLTIIIYFIAFLIALFYFSIQESSVHQATFGKRAVGVIVTDYQGNRISFGRAVGRFFGRIVVLFTLGIGYIIIGFTEKKQGLHDYIASTYVVFKN
jgi:uncharacterized RDD family membrane protein YckC